MNKLFLLLTLAVLFSCTVQQDISLEIDKSGTLKTEITLHPMLTSFFRDSAELDDEIAKYLSPATREKELIDSFILNPNLKLTAVSWEELDRLSLDLTFDDVENILPPALDGTGKDIIRYFIEDNKAVMNIFIDINNFNRLLGLFPLLESMDMLYFFPDPESPLTEEEYVEFIGFTFAEYIGIDDPDEALEKVGDILRTSNLALSIKGKTDITFEKKPGCAKNVKIERVNRKEIKVLVPILTLLTLEKPVDIDFIID